MHNACLKPNPMVIYVFPISRENLPEIAICHLKEIYTEI